MTGQRDASEREREQAFLAFYDATKAEVYGFLLARCGDHHVAEEVLAETYLEAARAGPAARLTTGWLITVARRRLIDLWRRQDRSHRIAERLFWDRAGRAEPASSTDDMVLEALSALPTRQRAVIALRYLDEYSVSEIADELDVTYKTAESLLARGRASLRRSYEEVRREQ